MHDVALGPVGLPVFTDRDVQAILETDEDEDALPDTELLSEFPWVRKLTFKQQQFILMYDGTNLSRCAVELKVRTTALRKWLEDVRVRYALRNRMQYLAPPDMVATRDERLAMWTDIMRDPTIPLGERLKASELLGKANCDFSERRILSGDENAPLFIVDTGVPRTPDSPVIDITPIVESEI